MKIEFLDRLTTEQPLPPWVAIHNAGHYHIRRRRMPVAEIRAVGGPSDRLWSLHLLYKPSNIVLHVGSHPDSHPLSVS